MTTTPSFPGEYVAIVVDDPRTGRCVAAPVVAWHADKSGASAIVVHRGRVLGVDEWVCTPDRAEKWVQLRSAREAQELTEAMERAELRREQGKPPIPPNPYRPR